MEKPQLGFGVSFVFLVVLVLSMFVSVHSQDAQVMAILRTALNNPSNLQWSDQDVCKWKHVQCNSGKRVTAIQIGNQNLQVSLPKELVQLTELEHFECQENNLKGPFPYLPKSLQRLFIHNNQFNSFPNDFFKGMTKLQEVNLDFNSFSQWQIPDSLKDCVALQSFSAQSASLVGTIPDFFGKDGPFPGLVSLTLSYNSLEGGLPASFSGSSLEYLVLNGQQSNSQLNGTLALLQYMTSLKHIWVHKNSFTGPIPDFSEHDKLYDVSLRDNHLTGVVPPSLTNLPSLQVVNLTNNYLQGPVPSFKSGVKVDNDVSAGRNQFCLNQPGQPCSALVNALLSVAEPLGYPVKFAESWKGNDPCDGSWIGIICSGGNITIVNFQNMGLSGTISPSFASLTSLRKLILANNDLTGPIPDELTTMPLLKELDLTNNHLGGLIPSFRKDVNLKLGGNPDIGKPIPSPPGAPGSYSRSHGKKITIIILIVSAIIILLGTAVLLFYMLRSKQKHSGKVKSPKEMTENPPRPGEGNVTNNAIAAAGASGGRINKLSPTNSVTNDVHMAEAGNMLIPIQVLRDVTNNFSEVNILGRGGFGTVYKGELQDGTKIAVKRMKSGMVEEKGLCEFRAEIAVLTNVRHRHLVALLGYCLGENERLLVYEYMPQGALSKHLFNWKEEGLRPLEWRRRLYIALDVARGVEYLHGLAQQSFIHRDLKPSNILLGDDMRAKVSDFGLVRLAPEGKASFETRVAGTFGYLAPEYAATGRVTIKVDVYSFGVILMEMITGRRALDDSQPEENAQLVTWFRRALLNKDAFRKAIDPTIDVDDEETLSSISSVAELAGHCCAREPYQRPDMSHAVNVLSPLVEVWKPSALDSDDMDEIDLCMSLPQALRKWQASDGNSATTVDDFTTSSYPTTQSTIPPRPPGFADSFTCSDGR